jgi:hypothetical protein
LHGQRRHHLPISATLFGSPVQLVYPFNSTFSRRKISTVGMARYDVPIQKLVVLRPVNIEPLAAIDVISTRGIDRAFEFSRHIAGRPREASRANFQHKGHSYDARIARLVGAVAQLGERRVRNAKVEGSIPFRSTISPSKQVHTGPPASMAVAYFIYNSATYRRWSANRVHQCPWAAKF